MVAQSRALNEAAEQVSKVAQDFPQDMITEAPVTSASLILGEQNPRDKAELARGLQNGWTWLKEANTLPEASPAFNLMAARARALAIPDPTQRLDALRLLDSIQDASPEEQAFLLAGIGGGASSWLTVGSD